MLRPILALTPLLVIAGAIPTPLEPRVLLITREQPQLSDLPSCLHSLGSYGSVSGSDQVFLASKSCVDVEFENLASGLVEGSMIPLDMDQSGSAASTESESSSRRLFWLGEAGVQGKVHVEGMDSPLLGVFEDVQNKADSLAGRSGLVQTAAQRILDVFAGRAPVQTSQVERLYETSHSVIFSASDRLVPILDTLIPSHLSLVALPDLNNLDSGLTNAFTGSVRKDLVDNLANLTSQLKFFPKIDRILNEGLDDHQLVRDVRYLTGESSNLVSRHSFTGGARQAAHWIRDIVQHTGAECLLEPFLPGFAPNVICTYPSLIQNATGMTIMSAHYDSRGSFGKTRAPGGDDDGSGSGHLLGIARAIGKQGVRFEKPVVLAFFAGEEQGLLGSHAYARQLSSENATVLLQVQADMLGYRVANEPRQLGLPATIETPEASWLIGNLSQIYSPELVVGRTAACCSDHQSFLGYNFPATQVFERNDWIADPEYHSSGDLSMR
ncbi:hypothetical protein FFLO_00129 [Filobasidium floriforme]|uniref:Peptide hydrolase n=1 Tax=Filobasidium floriforme TaxID=5210 RepID=A0A8K0JU04_9TREE|nr:hypothetical protein FFLO_00129 [Filobasidium floriforme]